MVVPFEVKYEKIEIVEIFSLKLGTLSNDASISNSFVHTIIFICYLSNYFHRIIDNLSNSHLSISTFHWVSLSSWWSIKIIVCRIKALGTLPSPVSTAAFVVRAIGGNEVIGEGWEDQKLLFHLFFKAIAMINSTIGSLLGTILTPMLLYMMVWY